MTPPTSCPDQAHLKGLLDGSLAGDEQSVLTEHLGNCQCCQHTLESLAVGDAPWAADLRHVDRDRPTSDSAFWPALRSLEQQIDVTQVQPGAAEPDAGPVELDFLAPAEKPGYLGRLGHFDVVEVIGRGGMGLVLKAFDECLHRFVAIKVLDPKLAGNETARRRFCREARAAAAVTHENVVAIHEVEHEESNDLPYLVMQYVAGTSLQDRLDHGQPLELKEILRIGAQAAAGLAAAHAQGLVHRDVKPANILLESGERVRITDFGLARAAEDVKLTKTGFVAGTPLYMAPEQASGEDLDHRTDLFSLGSVLYALCTGQAPFDGNTPFVVLRRITEETPRPIQDINPKIPGWLVAVIDKLLAKDPKDRFQSAADVGDILSQALAAVQSSSGTIPCPDAARRKRARIYRTIGAAVPAALLLGLFVTEVTNVTGVIGWMGRALHFRPNEEASPTSAEFSQNEATVWSLAFMPREDVLAMAVEDGTIKLWKPGQSRAERKFNGHDGKPIWSLAVAPDGKSFITGGSDETVQRWDPDTVEGRTILKAPSIVRAVAFGPRGEKVAAACRDGAVVVHDLKTGKEQKFGPSSGEMVAIAYSPDGKLVASGGTGKVIHLWSVATGREHNRLHGHKGAVYGLAFSPDGQTLASGGWDKILRIWDVSTGDVQRKFEGHAEDIWSVAFSPDGRLVATGSGDHTVKLWDVETGRELATFRGHTSAVHAVAFAPDGRRVAAGCRDGVVKVWQVPGR
jgi:serine/threonine protein kinase/sugar lactone lactonase YvrE